VLVIGGGNSGFEEGLHLATMARSVIIVEFNPEVKASQILQEKVAEQDAMRVIANHAVLEFKVKDDNQLTGVVVEDRASGELKEWHPDGVFVFIGLSPNSSFLPATIERDQWGFIKTDATLELRWRCLCRRGRPRREHEQAISAAGEGATAALMIRPYLKSLGDVNPVNSIERETLEVSRV
jgi:alkyl hydroperoxide reductase subunit AhpF